MLTIFVQDKTRAPERMDSSTRNQVHTHNPNSNSPSRSILVSTHLRVVRAQLVAAVLRHYKPEGAPEGFHLHTLIKQFLWIKCPETNRIILPCQCHTVADA